jgi:tripartite-type tricarboxylate transporter receptor subunit TctC
MSTLRRIVITTVFTSAALAAPDLAQAQPKFPAKPVRLVVPFSPGSQSDVLARVIGPKLSEIWGQPVVVETRTGAGGTIAAALVSRATPDGHTLLVSSTAFVIGAAVQPSLPYDPLKDFAGVTQLGYSTSVLVVAPSLGVTSVRELIALAQAKPGQVLFSSSGAGGGSHMLGERFRLAAGIKVQHVGFKGAADAVLEVMAGRVHFCIQSLAAGLAMIRDGRLLALAVVTPQRSPLLPDVPAMAEVLPGYERDGSFPLLAPAGTPNAVRQQISRDVARVFDLPDVRERLQGMGFVPAPTTPEEHDRILRAQIATFSKVAMAVGLKAR